MLSAEQLGEQIICLSARGREGAVSAAERWSIHVQVTDAVRALVALALHPEAPPQVSRLPAGWRVQLNPDGSFGFFSPPPTQGESQRTSHAMYKSDRSDLADIVRKLCEHVLAPQPPKAEDTP